MPLLSVTDLSTHFASQNGSLRAVDGVSFDIQKGETVGLVGESGCGKSTLGKTVLRLVDLTGGSIKFDDSEIGTLSNAALKPFRRRVQMVFQDPFASLNPRHTIGHLLDIPLKVHGVKDVAERRRRCETILDHVGLPRAAMSRFPHEFSGGQRQRIGIARALILEPELIVCDEPVSALDLSIQAQILNLLVDMKAELGLSYLFISHDLSVVRYFTDRILVMYLGRIVESGPSQEIWTNPRHPYTRALIDAIPNAAHRRQAAPLTGDLPNARNLPTGCRFHPRCPRASPICVQEEPILADAYETSVACHHSF